jgi:anaerobic selenocysteine-containing dehydrogenase
MKRMKRGGGWAAIKYTLRMANRVGWWQLWKAMRAKNACKSCALGMGGQAGGMRNEMGHWPEVCKKSLQTMVADMQEGLKPEFFQRYSIAELHNLSSRELEWCGRLTQPLFAGPADTHYRPIDWDSALRRFIDKLRAIQPDQNFLLITDFGESLFPFSADLSTPKPVPLSFEPLDGADRSAPKRR